MGKIISEKGRGSNEMAPPLADLKREFEKFALYILHLSLGFTSDN